MAHISQTLASLSDSPRLPLVAAVAVRFADAVTRWDHLYRSRKALRALDAHLLRDVGLTAEQARTEASRRFWQG